MNLRRPASNLAVRIVLILIILPVSLVMITGETHGASTQTLQATALVLVNQNSTYYNDFQHYLQPYLDYFGVPYTLLDIALQPLGPEIGSYALIIVGHRGLDRTLVYLDTTEQSYLSAAVEAGTGLVNFDNDLSSAGSHRYPYIEDIFGFGYNAASSGSGVTFVTADPQGSITIDCTDDDHQNPVLTTFTNPALFNDTDGTWDEFLWEGYRDYAGVFGGIAEAASGDLQMIHFYGDVPNGNYRLIANLYHSRDYRYFWGYTPENPRAFSFDVVSGPSGDFAEYELGTVEVTDGHFDLYTDYAQDLGGTSFAYFGWAWIRLVPIDAPPPGMHFITERHQSGENIPTAEMTLAGISLPVGVDALALTGTQPFLAAATHGQGRAVQWGSYDWMSHTVKGPVYGFDDLVWRSLAWAARKPFVLQGLPHFVTMRVDDVSGPFGWIEVANEFGIKPWAGLFYLDIDNMEAHQLSNLVNAGNATASVHANGEVDFFYYDHGVGDLPDSVVASNFAAATAWHNTYNIPISRFVLPHFYEFGTNVFQGLYDWGVAFVGTLMEPGSGYYSPWIMNGPYRRYEIGESNTELPTFYADFLRIPGHPEFDGKFFNCITEIRDDAGYEWYPSNDVPGSIGRGVRQTKRALDSMALATLFTHGYYLQDITTPNWRAILQGITDELMPYDPIYVTLDEACQYLRAMHTSDILSSSYDPDGVFLTTVLGGESDIPSWFHLFLEVDGEIVPQMVAVPVFNGSTNVLYPLNDALDQIVVTPATAEVAAGGTQQFTAQGYDRDGSPIPDLPFNWEVTAGGGTIDSNGLFTAGLTAGYYPNTVQASIWGISGTASVDVFLPVLDHFTFEVDEGPFFMDTPFPVTITARDETENLVLTYGSQVILNDTTGTIAPSTTGNFTSGSWTGEVTIGQANHQVTLTASDGSATGSSDPFEVLPLPDDYQVTSSSYQHLPGQPFLVTVTATDYSGGEDPGSDPPDHEIRVTSPQVPVLITMSATSVTMVFDGDGDGVFGEAGDDTKYLFGGSFSIMARDLTPGREVSIRATDRHGRYGYNVYSLLYVNFFPGILSD